MGQRMDYENILQVIPELEDYELIGILHALGSEMEARMIERNGAEEEVSSLPF